MENNIVYPEVSFTPEWKEGREFEKRRILKIIDSFCFGNTEETLEVKRSLNDAVGGLSE